MNQPGFRGLLWPCLMGFAAVLAVVFASPLAAQGMLLPAATEVGSTAMRAQDRPEAPSPGSAAGSGTTLAFTLDRAAPAREHYLLQLDQATGKGFYRGSEPTAARAEAASRSSDTPVAVPEAVLKRVFAATPLIKANRCESHRKGIAQTGTKTLRLVQNGQPFECSFNYSDEERVMTAAAVFEEVAATLQYGERLTAELRFDRLGLDAEMESLENALKDGRALEVGNIAPVLGAIQNDDRVMERVRRRAAHLLGGAGLPSGGAVDDAGGMEAARLQPALPDAGVSAR